MSGMCDHLDRIMSDFGGDILYARGDNTGVQITHVLSSH